MHFFSDYAEWYFLDLRKQIQLWDHFVHVKKHHEQQINKEHQLNFKSKIVVDIIFQSGLECEWYASAVLRNKD